MKLNYLFIPLIVIAVAILGNVFSNTASMLWYDALIKPGLTSADWAFPLAWTTIFFLSAAAAILAYNRSLGSLRVVIVALFLVNAVLNVLWSLLFFRLDLIGLAFMEILLLEASVIMLITVIWRVSKTASWLLAPYAVWVAFAAYLTFEIMRFN